MFNSKPHNEYLRLQEILKLERYLKAHKSPLPSDYIGITNGTAYWKVKTNRKIIDFCWPLFGMDIGPQDHGYIVHVDSYLFYKKWLEGTRIDQKNRSINCPVKKNMPLDKKFYKAAEKIEDIKNKIPLAKVTIEHVLGKERIFFIDGVTRTYWLLYNDAKTFPVHVDGKEKAEMVNLIAGIGINPISCQKLILSVSDEYEKHIKMRKLIKSFYEETYHQEV